ncbi:MAG: hypothetical protein GKR89_03985 [Candidatus Latescibacteria bacterium]|nr:hypothetical protein [Candidatus Latescibacterota bacterium]
MLWIPGWDRRTVQIALLSLGLLAPSVQAHVGDQIFPLYEILDEDLPDLHDASLDDWGALFPQPQFTEADFSSLNIGDGTPIGAPDLAVKVYLGWNQAQNKILGAIGREDDIYINTYRGGSDRTWIYDSIEFMVDGDHSGGCFAGSCLGESMIPYSDSLAINFQAQWYSILAQAPNNQLMSYGGLSPWVTQPPYSDAGGFVEGGTPHLSVVEFMVTPFDQLYFDRPEESAPNALRAGRIIGFEIALPDFDAAPQQYRGFHSLAGQPNTWREADNFVDGELLSAPRPTSKQIDSWGQIKATFR